MAAFSVTSSVRRDYVLLAVAGEFDLATRDRVGEHGINQLLSDAVSALVLDLREVSFIDSVGLGVLVRLRNVARHLGKQLVLVRVPRCVQRLLDLTGLDIYFEQQFGDIDNGVDTFLERATEACPPHKRSGQPLHVERLPLARESAFAERRD
jgi:anti-anti-sigma factor